MTPLSFTTPRGRPGQKPSHLVEDSHHDALCQLALQAARQIAYQYCPATRQRLGLGDIPSVLGYSAEEFCSWDDRAFTSLIHPDDQPAVRSQLRQAWKHPGHFDLSYRFRRKDGSYTQIHDRGESFAHKGGSLRRLLGTLSPVDSGPRSGAGLPPDVRCIQAVADSFPGPFFYTDQQGRYRLCNKAFLESIARLPLPQVIGRKMDEIPPPASTPGSRQYWSVSTTAAPVNPLIVIAPDGTNRHFLASKAAIRDAENNVAGTLGILIDITDQKRAEDSLLRQSQREMAQQKETERQILEYQEQLQLLMKDLLATEEKERQKIASDIHDHISQILAVCQMRLMAMAAADVPASVTREAKRICRLLDPAIQDTHSLIFELSPPVLHQFGLFEALEWFGEKTQNQHKIRIWIQGGCCRNVLPADQRTAVFRAVCELMNNAVKHGRATSIRVTLTHESASLRVQVKDNGVGFTPAEANWRKRKRGGFGLFHIRERLRALKGTMELTSQPGAGTSVLLTVPAAANQSEGKDHDYQSVPGG